ncbi:hypothetical protein AYJ54_06450 [Bradyrhizobium centrolobii]|uniref:Uncharacterized protein n=1 Tax=Bradyrhizobium centrolobii TaxID=1505087 RepID=A0A176YZY3_9BRAD|nr:hypothetical protein AYJ54_06450 [Bradyrhizobium centrolobii]
MSRAPGAAGVAAVSSMAMAGLGFALGALGPTWWNAGLEGRRAFAGACLLAAGSVLAFGG